MAGTGGDDISCSSSSGSMNSQRAENTGGVGGGAGRSWSGSNNAARGGAQGGQQRANGSGSAQAVQIILPHKVEEIRPEFRASFGWDPLPDNLNEIKLPVRKELPKENFKTVNIKVNHFPVNIKLPPNICRYQVTISKIPWDGSQQSARPPAKFQYEQLHRVLMERLRLEFKQRNNSQEIGIISDWAKTLYCTEPLEENSFIKEVEFAPAPGDAGYPEMFAIKVELTVENVSTKGLQGALDNMRGQAITSELDALDRIYNTLLKNLSNPRFTAVGRSSLIQFDDQHGSKLGKGLMSYSGYDINVDITNGWKPYLNILVANHATIMSGNVIDVMKDFFENKYTRAECATPHGWEDRQLTNASRFLFGFRVQYSPDKKLIFAGTIVEISKNSVSEETFSIKDKKTGVLRVMSVYEYYVEKYERDDLNPDGLCLLLNSKSQVPAEICFIKEGQSAHQKLTAEQTTKMLGLAKKEPHKLQLELEQAIADLELQRDPILAQFGVTIGVGNNSGMLKMPKARVLAPPLIVYKGNKQGQFVTVEPVNGVWDNWRSNGKFLEAAEKVDKWGILIACKGYKGGDLKPLTGGFVDKLTFLAEQAGLQIRKNFETEDYSGKLKDTPHDKKRNIQELTTFFEKKKLNGCQMILVVVPNDGSDLYSHVKQSAELETGLLTQCVNADHFSRPNNSEIKNILLKLNNKLGGINHTVMSPRGALPFDLFKDPVLILGADVTHPSPTVGSKNKKGQDDTAMSFAALVSSIDRTGMRFMTQVKAQMRQGTGATEVITDFDSMVKESLSRFKETSGAPPRKIIYFRDGVGDSQFTELLHTEMRQIRAACANFGQKYQPKITFITVQKRHKTRMFHQTNGRVENAPPGTVVDSDIVHPTEIDAFLLSHKGILGTSKPTHYRVLWDDSGFSEDQIQQMAYYTCHMYARCNRAVSIPAPTYYAHHAATRALVLAEGFTGTVEEATELLQRTVISKCNPMHFV